MQEVKKEDHPRVAPFAGAWIEIKHMFILHLMAKVAPFAGAWIEIFYALKIYNPNSRVAPFAGAWIEMQGAL